MNKAVSDAKAALRRICEEFDVEPEDWKPIEALIERLTAPLDADEGRELVHRLRVIALPDGLEAADLIERQAARIAALTAILEEVEGLCSRLDARAEEWFEMCDDIHVPIQEAAAALRAYAAREADRGRVDAEVREIALGHGLVAIESGAYYNKRAVFIEPVEKAGAIGADANLPRDQIKPGTTVITFANPEGAEVLLDAIRCAVLDTAKSVPPAPDLAKLRREVEALGRGQIDTAGAMAINAVLALIDREQEAGDA